MSETERQTVQQIADTVAQLPPEAQATLGVITDAFAAGVAAGQAIADLEQAAG